MIFKAEIWAIKVAMVTNNANEIDFLLRIIILGLDFILREVKRAFQARF